LHTRLFLRAESALARGSQFLEDAAHVLNWSSDPDHRSEISRIVLDDVTHDVNTRLVFEKQDRSSAFVRIQAISGRNDDSDLQVRVTQFVRPLSVLSPLGEAAPPLVINGCLNPPTASLEVRPLNADQVQASDAVWLNSDVQCQPMSGIDTHQGTITARRLGEDLWSVMFSVDRDRFAAMAAEQTAVPEHERNYRVAEHQDLIAGRWAQSVGSVERPVALYFPAALGCPGFAAGVQIHGVVFVDADCGDPVATQAFEVHGSLMINGNLNAADAQLRLNHIQRADDHQTRLQFPVLRSVAVPGTWSDF
jgi:hypothetical protein